MTTKINTLKAIISYSFLLTILILTFIGCDKESQRDPHYWAKQYDYADAGQSAYAMKPTADGGYIMAGTVEVFKSGMQDIGDIWVAKLDEEGAVQWQNIYSGSSVEIGIDGMDLETTEDGGYVVSCRSQSFSGSFSPWIFKLNSSGALQWQKIYDEDNIPAYAKSMKKTSDGGFVLVTGGMNRFFEDGYEFFKENEAQVIKLSANGTIEWTQGYMFEDGSEYEMQSIDTTDDGGYIIAGTITGPVEPEGVNNKYMDAVIIKLDSLGNPEWKRELTDYQVFLDLNAVKSVSDGYVAAGSYGKWSNSSNVADCFVVKFDLTGNLLWQKKFDISGGEDDVINSIDIAGDGSYMLAGSSDGYDVSDMVLAKVTTSGSLSWVKAYDAEGAYGMEMYKTVRGFAIAGYNGTGVLVSVDSNGNIPNAGSRIRNVSTSLVNTGVTMEDKAIDLTDPVFSVFSTSASLKYLSLSVETI